MLQPIKVQHEGKETGFACVHWKNWPPPEAFGDESIEDLRKKGLVTNEQYQQYHVWQRVCGLVKMDESKCRTCPHVRVIGVKDYLPCLITLDGTLAVPLIDRDREKLGRSHLVTSIRPPGSAREG